MRRVALIVLVLTGEFAVLEAGLRMFGRMEAEPTFQRLFMPDDRIGYRLRPGTSSTYSTAEFTTALTINAQGVRDAEPIGAKQPDERRVVILGDSFVFAIQVPFADTFGEQLERRLNRSAPSHFWRVINGGVQGYGPVEEWLFYRDVLSAFDPDIVLIVVSVGNDAIEAFDAKEKLALGRVPDARTIDRTRTRLRQVVRSSMVLQLIRLRADQLRARVSASSAERPLAGYLEHPPAFVHEGLIVAARAFGNIAAHARNSGAEVVFVLMPARFQTNDEDFRRVSENASRTGSAIVRNAATERVTNALIPLGVPMLDLLPVFASLEDPPAHYFVQNAHLNAKGHEVTAGAILEFLRANGQAAAQPLADGF